LHYIKIFIASIQDSFDGFDLRRDLVHQSLRFDSDKENYGLGNRPQKAVSQIRMFIASANQK